MGLGQAGAELTSDLQGLVDGQAANAPQKRGEVFAVHVLHGEKAWP
jgi:hypothetical protein